MEIKQSASTHPNYSTLSSFEDPLEMPQRPDSSCNHSFWAKRTAAAICFAGSVALKTANLYLLTNAIGSFGAGFAAVYTITCGLSPERVARIRQIVLPLIGQTAMFGFSQAWANDTNRGDQVTFDHMIIGCLGANMQFALGWLLQEGAIRNESQPPRTNRSSQFLHRPICSYKLAHGAKLISAIAFGVFAGLTKDPIILGISTFFASFFGAQVLGEKSVDRIDHEIEQRDHQNQGTRFRIAKIGLLTLAYLAQIVTFVPWYNPTSFQMIVRMGYSGATLGFFDGVSDRGLIRRAEQIPIEGLHELEKLAPPEKPESKCTWDFMKYQAYRIWKYSIPLIAVLGITGFTLWQEIDVLPGIDPKVTLGAMLFGYLVGMGGSHLIDYGWDPVQRHRLKDLLMTTIWFSPRFFGIDPLFFYYALTNAVKMDGAAVASQRSPYYLAAIMIGWTFYGLKMGAEGFIAGSERIGNLERKFQKMAAINGWITFKLYVGGQN